MQGIFVSLGQPAQSSTLSRSLTLTGAVAPFNGAINSVSVQFGAGGPSFAGSHAAGQGKTWSWTGLIPNNIRPGQAFQIFVDVYGTMVIGRDKEGDPITDDAHGQLVVNYTLENVVPQLTVVPFQSPIAVSQQPYTKSITGTLTEGNPALYHPKLQYQIGAGALTSVNVVNGAWSIPLSLAPGDYPITITASDDFASTVTFQKTLSVRYYPIPPSTDPLAKPTPAGVPSTSSITSWTRLEPIDTDADLALSSGARLFDPLWLMTRQWQLGEFQGEDAGTPVHARVRATNAPVSRAFFGELAAKGTAAPAYDPTRAPLEALVERRRMRAADATDERMLTLAVDAGLHFLRLVGLDAVAQKYGPAFLATYALQPTSTHRVADDAASRFVQLHAGRAPDARRLATAFRATGAGPAALDPALNVAAADVAAVQRVAAAWLAWYDALFAEPAAPADDAWNATRLEYAVSVAARLSAQSSDAVTLSASEFDGGRLDWSSFDVNATFDLDTTADHAAASIVEATVPAPVTFHGAPAPRFWEMEDAKVAWGLLPVGPTDLAHLLLIEYASSYGNDWYVVPLTTPVGSFTRVDSLVVTDAFGVRSLVRPIGDPALPPANFSLWQHTSKRYAGDAAGAPRRNLFFLAPSLGRSVDGEPVEDVMFLRDEMANVAWGVEHEIEGALEAPVPLATGAASLGTAPLGTSAGSGLPTYLLASPVPSNWVPLIPVQQTASGKQRSGLRRGAVRQPDGTNVAAPARSDALAALGTSLLFDEEVPREGVHITRRRRMTRWIDGSTWVWAGNRNEVGRGEGSAGLVFDHLQHDDAGG